MLQFSPDTREPWQFSTVATPVGPLAVAWSADVVVAASFAGLPAILFGRALNPAVLPNWLAQLADRACRRGSAEIRWMLLDPGLTLLQQGALTAAAGIPAGALASYGDLAREVGRPRAARAVGLAMSRSPADLFIPTHRVVRHNGLPAAGQKGGVGERLRQWEAEHAVPPSQVTPASRR